MLTLTTRRLARRAMLAITTLSIAAGAHAQALRVTAANASNSSVYDVTFSGNGGFITPLNTDANLHVSFRSLAFIPNAQSGKVDLIIADTSRGEIVRYANATGAAAMVWNTSMGSGPKYPDGLSLDGSGNLYVVTSASGSPKPAELWVLARDPSAPAGAAFLAPRLVDNRFNGIAVQALEETVSVRTPGSGANAGDLLVLSSSPAMVLVYSAAALDSVIGGSGPISPSATLIPTAQFPAGVAPGGMDIWPADGSLLVTTASGTVLRYRFTNGVAARAPDFATGLGNGKFKVRTGIRSGTPYAFVANNNGGDILEFGEPPVQGGSNPPLATVTSGVQRPQGIATTNLSSTDANACLSGSGGCDVLQNVLKHNVTGVQTLSGYVIEDACVVQVDPRIAQYGTCTGHSLPVAQVCAGYGNAVIPDYMCGGAGPTGSGFALIKSLTNSLDTAKGALIANEAFANTLLQSANTPCPRTVLAWAPAAGEGSIVEGNSMLELTGTCGSSGGLSRGLSVWGVGLTLNEAALPGKNLADARVAFAASKYDSLTSTISLASIQPAFRTSLNTCLSTSRSFFDKKKYANAAAQLVSCDALVSANEGAFTATANNPNPSGEIRGRLANLYLTLNSRILSNAPLAAWPPQ